MDNPNFRQLGEECFIEKLKEEEEQQEFEPKGLAMPTFGSQDAQAPVSQEMLAENIAQALFRHLPATRVLVRVLKQPPPIPGTVDSAGVEIRRERVR